MNKVIIPLLFVLVVSITIPTAFAITEGKFYGIEGGCCPTLPLKVLEINKNGIIISSVNMTGLGFNATGVNGLAVDPTDGTFYGIAKDQANATNRRLISINPVTGVAVDIGGMGNKFSTLGINGDGTLRAVTGLGATIPFEFHSVDKTTGQTTLLCTFVPPVVSTAGSIAFNSKDGNMYWLYGFRDDVLPSSVDQLSLIRIDNQSTCAFTVIPESGLSSFLQTVSGIEVIGLAYSITDDLFYGAGLRVPANPVNATNDGRVFFDVDVTGVFCGNICLQPSFPSLATFANVKGITFEILPDPRPRTANPSSSSPTSPSGGQQSVSQLSDVQPLTVTAPTPEPTTVDRALSLFDQLNSFFDFDRAEDQVTAPTAPSAPAPDQRESFVDRVIDFFSGLFG